MVGELRSDFHLILRQNSLKQITYRFLKVCELLIMCLKYSNLPITSISVSDHIYISLMKFVINGLSQNIILFYICEFKVERLMRMLFRLLAVY